MKLALRNKVNINEIVPTASEKQIKIAFLFR